jgi:hypothetical protein
METLVELIKVEKASVVIDENLFVIEKAKMPLIEKAPSTYSVIVENK